MENTGKFIKPSSTVLTRAARKKAGVAPPSPLFKDVQRLHLYQASPIIINDHTSTTPENDKATEPQDNKENQVPSTRKTSTSRRNKSGKSTTDQQTGKLTNINSTGHAAVSRKRKHKSTREVTKLEKSSSPSVRVSSPRADNTDSSDSEAESKKPMWVQCDHLTCQKWRRIPFDTDIDQTKDWYCSMHPDSAYQSCDTQEERWQVPKKRAFTFTRLEKGTLIWAKMGSYSPWPAVVSPDPWSAMEYVAEEREGCIYHVEFLGKNRSHLWIPEEKIEPYHTGKGSTLSKQSQSKTLMLLSAIKEADSLVDLSNKERLLECVFTEIPSALKRTLKTGEGRQKMRKRKKIKTESDSTQSTVSPSHCNQPLANVTNTPSTRNVNTTAKQERSSPSISGQAQILKCLGINITNLKGNTSPASVHDSATALLQSLQSHLTTLLKNTDLQPGRVSKNTTHLAQTKQVPTVSHTGIYTSKSLQESDSKTRNPNTQLEKSKKMSFAVSKSTSHISPCLVQASLGTGLNTNTVQVVPHKSGRPKGRTGQVNKKQAKRKSRLSPAKSRQKRQSPYTIVSPSIEDYFIKSSSTSPRDSEEKNEATGSIRREQMMTGAASMDQQVPGISESPLHPSLASEAQTARSELREIEDMLSMFEQPVPTLDIDTKDSSITKTNSIGKNVTKTNSVNENVTKTAEDFPRCDVSIAKDCSNSKIENQAQHKQRAEGAKVTGRCGHPDVEFDSVLNELQCIEGLIEDLGEHQVVPC